MIELNIEGIEAVRKRFARLVPEVKEQVLEELATVAHETAELQVDTHFRDGDLGDSLDKRKESENDWIIDHNLQVAPHALFVHWGTRAHDIRPRDRKALRWTGGQGGDTHYIFARFVHHPGYAGDPWLVTAAEEAIRQFDAIVRDIQGG